VAPANFDTLPGVIPVFPLSGVMLLPRGRLPLHIFEQRYLQMTEDAMSADRLIGMVQPIDPTDAGERPEIYQTGCVGRITSFAETDDNRHNIVLTGIARFQVQHELPPDALLYRRVSVDFAPFKQDLDAPASIHLDREKLVPALKDFFAHKGLDANWDIVEKSEDDELLIGLSMVCPFSPSEKQALLQCENSAERADMLSALIEMARYEMAVGTNLGGQQ